MIASLLLALATSAQPIALTCGGGGSANKVSTSMAYAQDSNGNSGWATVDHPHAVGFQDQVDLQIDGDSSRIRLPRTMLPPIHGGDGGWFKLKDLDVENATITASAAVNAINNPKIYIDRRTGHITISGKAGHYMGLCERSAPEDAPTKF